MALSACGGLESVPNLVKVAGEEGFAKRGPIELEAFADKAEVRGGIQADFIEVVGLVAAVLVLGIIRLDGWGSIFYTEVLG